MKNAQYDTFHIRQVCERKLGIKFKATKETNGWFEFDGKRIHRISVPKGRKTLPKSTYASIARQLKIGVEQFDGLLDCPLQLENYIDILREKGVVPPESIVNMTNVKETPEQMTQSPHRSHSTQ